MGRVIIEHFSEHLCSLTHISFVGESISILQNALRVFLASSNSSFKPQFFQATVLLSNSSVNISMKNQFPYFRIIKVFLALNDNFFNH